MAPQVLPEFSSPEFLLRSAPQLGGVRHRAGTAAGTAHRHKDVLLLFLCEIGAVEYLPRLLLEQLMQG
jgi:hypothetical protein